MFLIVLIALYILQANAVIIPAGVFAITYIALIFHATYLIAKTVIKLGKEFPKDKGEK